MRVSCATDVCCINAAHGEMLTRLTQAVERIEFRLQRIERESSEDVAENRCSEPPLEDGSHGRRG